MAFELYDQTKTAQGRLPVHAAELDQKTEASRIRFDLFTPQELAEEREARALSLPTLSIEGLSVMRTMKDVLAFASESGPLFGRSFLESVEDWQNAIGLASRVVALQEMLNGAKAFVPAQIEVQKSDVRVTATANHFSIYTAVFPLGEAGSSDYEKLLPRLPWLKKFRLDAGYDYSFISLDEEEGQLILTVDLLAFPQEISLRDFAAAFSFFTGDDALALRTLRELSREAMFAGDGPSAEEALGLLSEDENLEISDAELSEDDLPHLQKMVYAMISLHLQGIVIDVFDSSESDDFMVFDNYLSYLWYSFARQLGQVKIGYCEQCGKGFSLTGHRGIKRRFCSEKCKTRAKNARTKNTRERIREDFASGMSMADIAKKHFPGESATEAHSAIAAQIKKWPEVQQKVDLAILYRGEYLEYANWLLEEGFITREEFVERAQTLKESRYLRKKAKECWERLEKAES